MAEKLREHMEVVELAERAIEKEGLTPERVPIRGGTDGAQLSFRGLLCPNLGTGGYACHGPYEHITAEDMDTMVNILLHIVEA
jgi:tripeptide aminopeptidase